jgi:hypothetical protein
MMARRSEQNVHKCRIDIFQSRSWRAIPADKKARHKATLRFRYCGAASIAR